MENSKKEQKTSIRELLSWKGSSCLFFYAVFRSPLEKDGKSELFQVVLVGHTVCTEDGAERPDVAAAV